MHFDEQKLEDESRRMSGFAELLLYKGPLATARECNATL